MKKAFITGLLLLILSFLTSASSLDAGGFGITPPYVNNKELTRNSIYEQTIQIVRGNPDKDMMAEITIDVPEINDWITIDKGTEFLLPEGEQRVPMTVRVEVPDLASFDSYQGRIRIKAVSIDGGREEGAGPVSIALGAQVSFDIDVIDRVISDFDVRRVSLSNLNEGRQVRWLSYPGKIRFDIRVRNIGNVPVAPSNVRFDIYDRRGENLLETTHHTNKIKAVPPFQTEDVLVELPTHLPAGGYLARYTIYNEDEIKQEGELNLSILPLGTVEGDDGYGFMGLSLWHKTTIVGPIALIALMIIALTFASRRLRLSLRRFLWRVRRTASFLIQKKKRALVYVVGRGRSVRKSSG